MNAKPFSEDKDACPICRTEAQVRALSDLFEYLCPRCGRFNITGTALTQARAMRFERRELANVAGWLRDHGGITLNSRTLEQLPTTPNLTVAERGIKVLAELGKQHPTAGTRFELSFASPAMAEWMGISWSTDPTEVEFIFCEYLIGRRLIEGDIHKVRGAPTRLTGAFITPEGHAQIEKQRFGGVDSAIGFCAMWFSAEMLPVWTEGISPAIKKAGYRPERIDNLQHNNKIDDEIIAMIRNSRFVVADFTGNRGGVYFEAGFAMGRGIPVIWTIRSDDLDNVHFDNRQYNFIVWEAKNLNGLAKALENRIQATIGQGPITR